MMRRGAEPPAAGCYVSTALLAAAPAVGGRQFFAARESGARPAPRAHLRWLSAPPAELAAGAVLDFRVRLLGWPIRWRVMVREFDPPYRFVDVQLWGPFARWEHRHRFVTGSPDEGGPGIAGTWVKDRLTYRLPLAGSQLAHALCRRPPDHHLFDRRAATLDLLS